MAALIAGPVGCGAVAETAGWPDDPVRAAQVAAALVDDGLAAIDGAGRLCLP